MKPKAPKPPDPTLVAQGQTDTSIGTAIANSALGNVNQTGPNGSIKYNQVGTRQVNIGGKTYDIPITEAVTELDAAGQQRKGTTDAAQQNMADIAKLLSGQIQSTAGQPVSMDGLPELPGSGGYEASRSAVEGAINSRLNPQLERARAARETDLANRGIRIGSASYDRAMEGVGQNENDARMQTILAGGQEQSRMAALDSQARAQGMSERMAVANDPVNRLTALLSGSQVQNPQFQSVSMPSIPTTDTAGITQQGYSNQMDAWKQKMAQQNELYGGLFNLGSSAIMASDVNLKKDIEPVGEAGGHNVYAYRYKHEGDDEPKRVGVMAQEVEQTNPDAVVETPIGKAVNYRKLGLSGLGLIRVGEVA